MDRRRYLLAGAAALVLFTAQGDLAPQPGPGPNPGPAPNPADVQQLRGAFGSTEAGKLDCLKFGALCRAVGYRLDLDTAAAADKRRLKTAGQLNDFRRQVREDYLGEALSSKYPLLGPYLVKFWTERVGEFDDKLDTDAKRQAWSLAFADLSAAAQEAAR